LILNNSHPKNNKTQQLVPKLAKILVFNPHLASPVIPPLPQNPYNKNNKKNHNAKNVKKYQLSSLSRTNRFANNA
jgi:hypothetical protein